MIVAAMIVGPGESLRWLDRTLRRTARWADELIILCDRDADTDTVSSVEDWATYWQVSQENAFIEDEARLRNELFLTLDQQVPDDALVVIVDADEDLVTKKLGTPKKVLRAIDDAQHPCFYGIGFAHAWTPDLQWVRTDGGWVPGPQVRMYRQLAGRRLVNPRRLACGAVPDQTGRSAVATVPELGFLHLGYARGDDRQSKAERYATLDGGEFHSRSHIDSILDPEPTLVRTSTCLP